MDIIWDALLDTLKTLPFLFGVYLLIEHMEHHSGDKLAEKLRRMGPFGAIGGGLLGAIPQCGFSVAAANLYSGALISPGTLVAVFISTSDEAVPLLISNPGAIGSLWKFILIKTLIAIVFGILTDIIAKALKLKKDTTHFEELCKDCDCEHHSIWVSALIHTASIALFILVINLALGFIIEKIGEDNLGSVMMNNSFIQPFITALVGFIPNCAASVVITQLYISGVVSFGAAIAGLSTGAGLGLLILFKTNKHFKENLLIMALIYIYSVSSGVLLDIMF